MARIEFSFLCAAIGTTLGFSVASAMAEPPANLETSSHAPTESLFSQMKKFESSNPMAIFLDDKGVDSRQEMTSHQYPWSTIGRIYRDNGDNTYSTCTGTLVGRNVMVTAAHCVLYQGKIRGILFQVDYVNGVDQAEARSGWITVGTTDPDSYWKDDWAVVQLDRPLGDSQGWMGTQTIYDMALPLNVLYAGYSNNFENSEVAGADNCFIRAGFNNGTYGHDCSMGPGGSGGPLFFTDSGNQTHIVAVNTRGMVNAVYSSYSDSVANIAVMETDLVSKVREYLSLYDR